MKKEKKIANYLKDYKSLPMLERLKYLSKDFLSLFQKDKVDDLQLTFLGATKTVTGSKYLLEYKTTKILVDCGLFQGPSEFRRRNWNPLPVHPKDIDAVVLTHAHIDHTGYLPLLVKKGFKGKIYCTDATYNLCKILLPDSGFLQEEDTRYAKKHKYSKHLFPKPLYTQKDAYNTLKYFKTVDFNQTFKIDGDFSFTFIKAGHIVGAASIFIEVNNKSILFSGDLGRKDSPIIAAPDKIINADYIVTESTYGNRVRTQDDSKDQLEEIINSTIAKNGKVIIPAFAVGRTQKVLYYINELKNEKRIPDVPIFLDSPMSVKVTSLTEDYIKENKLTLEQYRDIYQNVKFCITRQQSKRIFTYPNSAIIISANGMATGGRILHHIDYYGQKPNSSIVFVGYQVEGTRGRDLIDGKKQIKLHGKIINITAKICKIDNMSEHADSSEILSWLKNLTKKPKLVFITHGEQKESESLAEKIQSELKFNTKIPNYLEIVKL